MFLSERNVKKQLFRVKQLADQTFARAEKSEVLTDDLVNAEKRVELIKHVCINTVKKIQAGLQGQGTDGPTIDKRLKKLPDFQLASTMLDSSSLLGESSLLGSTMSICGKAESEVASCLLTHEVEVEKLVVAKLQEVLDNDIPSITKIKKQLSKLTLDMDSAKARHVNATRHSIPTPGNTTKVENIKEELDDATARVVQCKDALAEEMFSLLAKEHDLSQCVLHLVKSQADYHRKVLGALEGVIPNIEKVIENHSSKPVYGFSLEEHLRITERKIALPIETCVCFLMECGLEEEGLFRIAGSASKVKKLKNAFDAGFVDMTDYVREPHAVAGALKQYLRELPLPLMTFTLYEEWLDTARHTETDARVKAMWNVIRELPEPYYNNLRYLIKFLSKLTDLQDVNKMSPQNVAIVMGPNLMWSANEDPSTLGMNMSLANTYSSIIDLLIEYSDYFFEGDEEFFVTTPKHYLTEYLNSMFPPTSADSLSNGDADENTSGASVPTERTVTGTGIGSAPSVGSNAADVDVQFASSANNKSPKLPRRMKKPAPPVPPPPNVTTSETSASSAAIGQVERHKTSSLPERPPIFERSRGHERKSSWLASDVVLANKNVEPESVILSSSVRPPPPPTTTTSSTEQHSAYLISSSTSLSLPSTGSVVAATVATASNVTNSSVPPHPVSSTPSGSTDGHAPSHAARPQPVPRPSHPYVAPAKTQGNGSCGNGESPSSAAASSAVTIDDCPFADDDIPVRENDRIALPPSPVRRSSLETATAAVPAVRSTEKTSDKAKDRPPRPANLPVQMEKPPERISRTRSLRNTDRTVVESSSSAAAAATATAAMKYSTGSVDRCRVKQNYANISDVFFRTTVSDHDHDDDDSDNDDICGDGTDVDNEKADTATTTPTPMPPERPEKFDKSKMLPPARPVKSERLKSLLDHQQQHQRAPNVSSVNTTTTKKAAGIFGSLVKEKPARPSYSPSFKGTGPAVNRVAAKESSGDEDDAKPQQQPKSIYPSLVGSDEPNDVHVDVHVITGPTQSPVYEDFTPRRQGTPSSPVCPTSPGLPTSSSSAAAASSLPSKPPRPQPRPPLPPVAKPRSVSVTNPEQTHL